MINMSLPTIPQEGPEPALVYLPLVTGQGQMQLVCSLAIYIFASGKKVLENVEKRRQLTAGSEQKVV